MANDSIVRQQFRVQTCRVLLVTQFHLVLFTLCVVLYYYARTLYDKSSKSIVFLYVWVAENEQFAWLKLLFSQSRPLPLTFRHRVSSDSTVPRNARSTLRGGEGRARSPPQDDSGAAGRARCAQAGKGCRGATRCVKTPRHRGVWAWRCD